MMIYVWVYLNVFYCLDIVIDIFKFSVYITNLMTDCLLDEYVKITKTIESIQKKIDSFKNDIEISIENAQSENEQNEHVEKFKEMMGKLKTDPEIIAKFKSLKKRQLELKKLILPCTESEIDQTVKQLKIKYVLLSKKTNSNNILQST